jgi:hypothetical protein
LGGTLRSALSKNPRADFLSAMVLAGSRFTLGQLSRTIDFRFLSKISGYTAQRGKMK